MKKRKLNSKNPKYLKEDEVKMERTLIGNVRGVKIYTIKYL
tara:strand:+ start:14695 stop:14817 length:123 start_codon:yes stop_codon:yes gene_type:complete